MRTKKKKRVNDLARGKFGKTIRSDPGRPGAKLSEVGKNMEEQFMTVKELAEFLRLKPLAIYRMVKAKNIPFKRANRTLRFDKEEIDQWMRWGKR